MFRNEADLRAFASKAFALYKNDTFAASTGESSLDASGYYHAYLVVFGVPPSSDEVELTFLRHSHDGLVAPVTPSGAHTASVEDSRTLFGEEKVTAALTRLRAKRKAHFTSQSSAFLLRDDFLKRVVEKYTLLHGTFRDASDDTAAWALFGALDTEHRGYFDLADVERAVERYKRDILFDEAGLTQQDKAYLASVYALCGTEGDGRVGFERYERIRSGL